MEKILSNLKKLSPKNRLYNGLLSSLIMEFSSSESISERMMEVAKEIRGERHMPSIFIHGIMPRSGTVYLGELLKLHPEIYVYPNDIRELPFLTHAGELFSFQRMFFQTYKMNRGRIGKNDLMCVFGAGVMKYLLSFVPDEKYCLMKVPHVQFVNEFFTFFPFEKLILLIRDGRDVVHSTLNTWKNRKFREVCKRWNLSAKLFLRMKEHFGNDCDKVRFVYYEDLLKNPYETIKAVLKGFGIAYNGYPRESIEQLPIRGSSAIKVDGKVSWEPKENNGKIILTGKWKSWKRREKRIFKSICGKTMVRTGYIEDLDF